MTISTLNQTCWIDKVNCRVVGARRVSLLPLRRTLPAYGHADCQVQVQDAESLGLGIKTYPNYTGSSPTHLLANWKQRFHWSNGKGACDACLFFWHIALCPFGLREPLRHCMVGSRAIEMQIRYQGMIAANDSLHTVAACDGAASASKHLKTHRVSWKGLEFLLSTCINQ